MGSADSACENILRRAFQEKRVAHICIHNQRAYLLRDTVEGTEERDTMQRFCHELAAFTKLLAPHALTVRAQYDIDTFNKYEAMKTQLSEKPFKKYEPSLSMAYEPGRLKVKPESRNKSKMTPIDLVDPDYDQLILIAGHSDVFDGRRGAILTKAMRDNGRDVLLFSGLYAAQGKCVYRSTCAALAQGFKTYVLTDRVFNYPAAQWRLQYMLEDSLTTYPRGIHRIDSASVMRLAH